MFFCVQMKIITTTGANFALTVFAFFCLYRGLTEDNEPLYHMSIGYVTLAAYFIFMSIFVFIFGSLIARKASSIIIIIYIHVSVPCLRSSAVEMLVSQKKNHMETAGKSVGRVSMVNFSKKSSASQDLCGC